MPSYTLQCSAGHQHDRQLTKEQFVDGGHRCPVAKCGKLTKRAFIPVSGGVAKIERDLHYPHTNWQLPLQLDPATGKRTKPVVIESKKHEANICAGALNGDQFRMNQL